MQVKEYLKNLNIHKSVDPDDLNLEVWRELANAALQISTLTEQVHNNIVSNHPPFRKCTGSKIYTINILSDFPGINGYLGQVTMYEAIHRSLLYDTHTKKSAYQQERAKHKQRSLTGWCFSKDYGGHL